MIARRRRGDLALIRLALLEARDAIEHYRANGVTQRNYSPLPDRRSVRLYNRAYEHGLRRFS